METTTRYRRRSYHAPDRGFLPEPGTTFSEIAPAYLPPCAEWVEDEDREAYRADLFGIQETAEKMRKDLLRELLETNGVFVQHKALKRDMVIQAVALEMRRRWPILVVA